MAFIDSVRRLFEGDNPFEDEDEDITSTWSAETGDPYRSRRNSSTQKEVQIRTNTQLKVLIYRPGQLTEVRDIADELRAMKTVVLNLSQLDAEHGRQMLDILAGVAYMLDANILHIAQRTYMFLPYNVDFEGDLAEELDRSGIFRMSMDNDDDDDTFSLYDDPDDFDD